MDHYIINSPLCIMGGFDCGNYSKEETIQGRKVLNDRRFSLRKLFKGGNYMRKYGKQIQLNLDCIFVKIDNK